MKITFDPINGETVPDLKVDKWWKERVWAYDPEDFPNVLGSDLMVQRARVGLAEGEIDELVITYDGVDYEFKNPGALPVGNFWMHAPDTYMNLLSRLLD